MATAQGDDVTVDKTTPDTEQQDNAEDEKSEIDDVYDEFVEIKDWIPSTVGDENQKVFGNAEFSDRRKRIVSGTDDRLIMQCFGRILSHYSSTVHAFGTGTVFDYDDKYNLCYVLTCAHNVIHDKKQAIRMSFQRVKTIESKITTTIKSAIGGKSVGVKIFKTHKTIQHYPIIRVISHPDYAFRSECINDIAIMIFVDSDGFYGNLLREYSNKGQKIKITNAEKTKVEFILRYNLYGYPIRDKDDPDSKVIDGGLYGMNAESYSIFDNQKMYIKLNDDGTMYEYNALDTEGGQSGSSLFIDLDNGGHAIVGVHTGGSKGEVKNWAVALNSSKIQWIEDTMKEMITFKVNEKIDWKFDASCDYGKFSNDTSKAKHFIEDDGKTLKCTANGGCYFFYSMFSAMSDNDEKEQLFAMKPNSGIYTIKITIGDISGKNTNANVIGIIGADAGTASGDDSKDNNDDDDDDDWYTNSCDYLGWSTSSKDDVNLPYGLLCGGDYSSMMNSIFRRGGKKGKVGFRYKSKNDNYKSRLPCINSGDRIVLTYNSNLNVLSFSKEHKKEEEEKNDKVELNSYVCDLPKKTTFFWFVGHSRGKMTVTIG